MYHKSHADFHRKDLRKTLGKPVSEEFGLEYGKFFFDFQEYISEEMKFNKKYSKSKKNPFR